MIRVFVVDDHSIFREGVRQILEETPDIRVAGEASNGRDALDQVVAEAWDVLLMDLSMPEGGGLEALQQIRSVRPDLPVLILSMYPEAQYAVRVLKAGAAGYLNKDAAPDELVDAVRKVAAGRKYVNPEVAEHLVTRLGPDPPGLPHEALSDREFQVLRLIASGKTVTDIGLELALSVKTVSTYRSRILDKMGMSSNAELTRYALENQLV